MSKIKKTMAVDASAADTGYLVHQGRLFRVDPPRTATASIVIDAETVPVSAARLGIDDALAALPRTPLRGPWPGVVKATSSAVLSTGAAIADWAVMRDGRAVLIIGPTDAGGGDGREVYTVNHPDAALAIRTLTADGLDRADYVDAWLRIVSTDPHPAILGGAEDEVA